MYGINNMAAGIYIFKCIKTVGEKLGCNNFIIVMIVSPYSTVSELEKVDNTTLILVS